MFKSKLLYLFILSCLLLASRPLFSQEFPIAVGNDTADAFGAAFDGTNFLVSIQGDTTSPNSITAQLVSQSGSLIGSRISLGSQGAIPLAAFDGSNYLVAWTSSGTIFGQFLNPSGTLVGSKFTITSGSILPTSGPSWGTLVFGDTAYFVTFAKSDSLIYGQRVSKTGELAGSQVKISTNSAREAAAAFDGQDYLVVWVDHYSGRNVFGQLIDKSGNLVGSNFTIDGSNALSDNPVSVAFDGSKYFAAFHDEAANGRWNLYGRFVSTSGVVNSRRITISDSSKLPGLPNISFDGKNYMITWGQYWPTDSGKIVCQFFDTSGVPIGTASVLFDTLGGKFPLFGGPCFGSHNFLVVTNRVYFSIDQQGGGLTFWGGQAYGRMVQSTTAVHDGKVGPNPDAFSLSQNYPNPFNPTTVISYKLSAVSDMTLRVYDVLGREVETLVHQRQDAGGHSVTFNAASLPSGVYFYRLQAGTYSANKKLLLLK